MFIYSSIFILFAYAISQIVTGQIHQENSNSNTKSNHKSGPTVRLSNGLVILGETDEKWFGYWDL